MKMPYPWPSADPRGHQPHPEATSNPFYFLRLTVVFQNICLILESTKRGVDEKNCDTVECGAVDPNSKMQNPWLARLYNPYHPTDCTATLISSYYALTARHCVEGNDDAHQLRVGYLRFPYSSKTPHYAYDVDFITKHDTLNVALLRLAREVHWTSEVHPICLHPNISTSELKWAGWLCQNKACQYNKTKNSALFFNATRVDNKNCIRQDWSTFAPFLQSGSVCAQNSKNLRKNGPLGGAVTADVNGTTFLVGVIEGPGDATSSNRTFSFVPTNTFYDWVMEKQLPEPKATRCHDGRRKSKAGFCLTEAEEDKIKYFNFMDSGDSNITECQKGNDHLFVSLFI
jgi:hypothetical protein